MANLTIEEQIRKTSEKLQQLKARQAAVSARKNARLAAQSREDRRRRLVLTGAAIYKLVNDGVLSQLQVDEWLNAGLIRETDRRFLNLPVLAATGASESKNDS
ncbi:hypothetical protein [Paraburkholderia acidipaludis]|uniref:hypothetical protein n=1 Tax=Paraburkholderia acidipaludis TaxID=660537 RepID=UPI0012EBD48D|nr:hypothetical protein [Paraburkholderia acidipaludis]